ncbi:MAG: PLP-dependent aminotransferase family protein [Oscillospiraceae bacterium]|nr:PLP-dependent aminotransferase family protein [Oscillospiraceae bacterium]
MQQITLELEGKSPMYEQLYTWFSSGIRSGRFRAREKLPSKRALCAHLGVSQSTVETAYALLVSEGYVHARPRSGYFVSDFVPDAAAAAPAETGPAARQEAPPVRDFDFSTSGVDVSLFPYSAWAKLNREVIYGSPELLQRGDRQGDPELRAALSAFLSEYRGVRCAPEQIVVGAGIEYLSGLLVQLFPPDTVFGLEDPGYAALDSTLRSMGRAVHYLPMDADGVTPETLERSGVSVAYLTPSHQFPMGLTVPADRRSRLLHWAASAPERYLIEDDYDSEFRYGARPVPAMQGMDGAGRVIYVGTFSRSLAPSIRVAWLVLPESLLRRYHAVAAHSLSTVSRYEQAVLARLLREGIYARYLRRLLNLYRSRRARLLPALEAIEGVSVSGSGGGLHFLLHHARYDEAELLARAREQGIILRGLSAYCRDCAPPGGTVVMGFGGLRDERIEEALRRLRAAWGCGYCHERKD